MILDSEVLLIDNKTGKPLPFGTLGVHKVLTQGQMCKDDCACRVHVCVCASGLNGEECITYFGLGLFFISELFLNLVLSLDVFCFCFLA